MEKLTKQDYTVKWDGTIEVKTIISFIDDEGVESPPTNHRDTITKGDLIKAKKYGLDKKLEEDWK